MGPITAVLMQTRPAYMIANSLRYIQKSRVIIQKSTIIRIGNIVVETQDDLFWYILRSVGIADILYD